MEPLYQVKTQETSYSKPAKAFVTLLSADDDSFEIDIDAISCSTVIKNLIEDLNPSHSEGFEVPLPIINTPTLKLINEWCTYHYLKETKEYRNCPEEKKRFSYHFAVSLDGWDLEFLNENWESVYELLSAADYINIYSLKRLCIAYLVKCLNGKDHKEIKLVLENTQF